MAHVIHIPDELYQHATTLAKQRGQTAEEVIIHAAKSALQVEEAQPIAANATIDVPGYDPALDPLAPFAGKYTALRSKDTGRSR
jgi:hypothetical protein